MYAALCVKGEPNVARVIEGPVPEWKVFGPSEAGNGLGGADYGLPRFDAATFTARFPFGMVGLSDAAIPLQVTITGWSPFIPGDADNSSLPVAALEYTFHNPTGAPSRPSSHSTRATSWPWGLKEAPSARRATALCSGKTAARRSRGTRAL